MLDMTYTGYDYWSHEPVYDCYERVTKAKLVHTKLQDIC